MTNIFCLVGMHSYRKHTADGGDAFLVCQRCGKESFPDGIAGGGAVPY